MPIVFGTNREKTEYFQKKGLGVKEIAGKVPVPEETEDTVKKSVLDISKLEPLTDDELRILSRTRHFNDETIVYMQPDVTFYDRFYSDTSNDPLTIEAHRIRRIYRNYRDYVIANIVREKYLERILDEEFGGDEDMYWITMGSDNPPYWIPPKPIFSKGTKHGVGPDNFDLFDMQSLCDDEIDPEKLNEVMDAVGEDRDLVFDEDPGESTYSDVCVDIDVIKYLEENAESIGLVENEKKSKGQIRSISDEFNAVIRSWYQDEKRSSGKDDEDRIFKYSEKKLREKYYRNLSGMDVPDNIDEIINDPEWFEKDHTDYNAMVRDPDTGRVMTLKEFQDREMIKQLGNAGWGELRLMNLLSVGSTYDRMKKSRRELKSTIRKNKLKPETLEMQRRLREGLSSQGYESPYDQYDMNQEGIVESLSRTLGGGRHF